MVEPINPKTILPRSLDISRLEQSRKNRPTLEHNQLAQDLQQKRVVEEERVNEYEKTEHKKIKDEDQNHKKNDEKEEEKSKQDLQEEEEGLKKIKRGHYIDIKV